MNEDLILEKLADIEFVVYVLVFGVAAIIGILLGWRSK